MTEIKKTKEHEQLYFKIINIIDSCDDILQLKFCGENLVNIFKKRKFKSDKPSKKEMSSMTYELLRMIGKKKNSIRQRIYRENREKRKIENE